MRRLLLPVAILSLFVLRGTLTAQDAAKKGATPKSASQDVTGVAKLVVFDGDSKGDNAKGWAVPEGKATTIKAQDKEVRTKGKKTVEFHAEGNEWLGCGWNWFGWSPADGGTDISKYKNVTFWARLSGDKKPTEISLSLGSSDNTATETTDMMTYCPELPDGKWHEVVVPIKDLDTKNALNKAKVWDIRFGTWSQEELSFSLFVDEIGFDSRPEKKAR